MSEEDIVARVGALVREAREAEPDPEAARPLDADAVGRIAAKLMPSAPAEKPKPAKVIAFPRWARTYAAPIAVAAAVVLFVATRDHGEHGIALPEYGLSANAERALRGDAPAGATLRVGKDAASRFEIVARPATSVSEAKVVAYVFAIGDESPEPVAIDAKVDVSKEGAVRITGDAKKLGTSKELRIVLATPESIAGYGDAVEHAKSAKGDDARVRVLSVPIEREGR